MMKNNRIKIAQIGLGHDHASMALRSILKQDEIFDFLGLCVLESEEKDFIEKVTEFNCVKKITLDEILNNSDKEHWNDNYCFLSISLVNRQNKEER